MSHSKRNTSLAFFTAHERNELKGTWGSRSTRLTRESFLPFGYCQLCLLKARDPVACPSQGHLFCRECAVSNLLAQSKELKRLKKEAERRKVEDHEEQELLDVEAQARAIEDFERVQAGLSSGERIVGRRDGKVIVERDAEGPKGQKRKFELDEDDLLSRSNGAAPRRRIDEKSGSTELPSFWVPSQTPQNHKAEVKAIRQQPKCPVASATKAHDFSLKSIVTVKFHQEKASDDSDGVGRTCPSCNKVLSNTTKAILAKPCGHVLCKPCSDKFQTPPQRSAHDREHDDSTRCYVCQEDVTPVQTVARDREGVGKKSKELVVERGLVELSSEGTGFAGGGKNMVKKEGLAFQC